MECEEKARRRFAFHYRGMLEDGTVFFDSAGKEPMECTEGRHEVMSALEAALCEMEPGEERTVHVGKAYGDYDESAVQRRVLRYLIPGGDDLQEGQEIMWTSPQNPQKPIPARIVRADEYTFDIDFNHPLAGKDLTYWVNLVSVS